MLTIILALLAACSNALASVLQRKANRDEAASSDSGLAIVWHLLRRPVWLGGIGAVIASFGLQAAALSTGELALVQPLLSLELPITLLLGSLMFHRRLGRREWAPVLEMTVALALLLYALQPTGGSAGAPGWLRWLFTVGPVALLLGLLAAAGVATSGSQAAALFGTAAGVSFALTATFMSGALSNGLSGLLLHWQTYLVLVAGLLAMVLLQMALRSGTLVAAQPGMTLVDPIVSILLGVLLFHERVRSETPWIVLAVVAAAVMGWAVVRLSRSPLLHGKDPAKAPDEAPTGPKPRNQSVQA